MAHRLLRSSWPGLLLVLVPRHPHRGAAVAARAAALGLQTSLLSREEGLHPSTAVQVRDALGELPSLYAACGVAHVGGSHSVATGGHNLLEAAQAIGGCVALHGPHTEAVAAAAASLAATTPPAAARVADAEGLAAAVTTLLRDEARLQASREAAAATARRLERGLLRRVATLLAKPLRLPEGCRCVGDLRG